MTTLPHLGKITITGAYTFLMLHSGRYVLEDQYSQMLTFVSPYTPPTPPTPVEKMIALTFFAGYTPALIVGMPGIVAYKYFNQEERV